MGSFTFFLGTFCWMPSWGQLSCRRPSPVDRHRRHTPSRHHAPGHHLNRLSHQASWPSSYSSSLPTCSAALWGWCGRTLGASSWLPPCLFWPWKSPKINIEVCCLNAFSQMKRAKWQMPSDWVKKWNSWMTNLLALLWRAWCSLAAHPCHGAHWSPSPCGSESLWKHVRDARIRFHSRNEGLFDRSSSTKTRQEKTLES